MPADASQPQRSQNNRFLFFNGFRRAVKLTASPGIGQAVGGEVQNIALVGFQQVPAGGPFAGRTAGLVPLPQWRSRLRCHRL